MNRVDMSIIHLEMLNIEWGQVDLKDHRTVVLEGLTLL